MASENQMNQMKTAFTTSLLLFAAFAAAMLCGCGSPAGKSSAAPEARKAETEVAPEPSANPSADRRPVIVAFGDSLTAGLGVDPSGNYPSKLQARLDAEGYHYRVVNAGISGETSGQGLNRLNSVREVKPAIVILALGANDGLRGIPVETTRRNLDEIIRTLRSDGIVVVLAGMEMPPNYGPQYTAAFRELFAGLARQYHLPFVPFLLAGVGGRPELNQEDGVHPTAQGYTIVAENVWRTLKPLLDQESRSRRS